MIHRMLHRSLHRAICCAAILIASNPSNGEIIRQQLPTGLSATAQLLVGDEDKKVVLIQHGFLQTREFFTVQRLGDALHDLGYTVLMPNLSLGIDNRRQSLACEAIHTHSLGQDLAEIGFWVDWLYRRSDRPVTLIGHSLGSLELFAYLVGNSSPPVDQAILISLIPFAQGPIAKENEEERRRALGLLAQGDESISSYRLAFCDNYFATAKNYLSYVEWSGVKTLQSLKIPSVEPTILVGEGDHRLGNDWLPALLRSGANVIQIPGANHFFDHEYEFDLVDSVAELLGSSNRVTPGKVP